jgi:hypothetical protein
VSDTLVPGSQVAGTMPTADGSDVIADAQQGCHKQPSDCHP